MGAPATQGKLCVKLSEMKIGDYIKCKYSADTANVAGVFSGLGLDYLGAELPIASGVTANGFFYFIKASKSLLIADRCVQKSISWTSVNNADYVFGRLVDSNIVRILSETEFDKYISGSNFDGTIIVQDNNVWHTGIGDANTSKGTNIKITGYVEKNLWCDIELLQNSTTTNTITRFKANGEKYSSAYWYYATNSTTGDKAYSPIVVSKNSNIVSSGGGWTFVRSNLCFRPVMEYIENSKSKTIWY